jgi:hypothetical protein
LRIRRSPQSPESPDIAIKIVLSRDEWRFYEMALHGAEDGAGVRLRQKIERHLRDIVEFDLDEGTAVVLDAEEVRLLVQRGVAYARAVMRSGPD